MCCAGALFSRCILQSGLVLGRGSSVPNGDGGDDIGLNDRRVEVHHHRLWQVEFLQLPQEVPPLLGFFDEGADVKLPLQVLGDDGAQEADGLHNVHWGFTQGDGGRWGCALLKIHNPLHCRDSVEQ